MIRSPTWRVGSIDPEGMENVWITKVRSTKVNPTTRTRMIAHSISHRPADPAFLGLALDAGADVSVVSIATTGGPYCTVTGESSQAGDQLVHPIVLGLERVLQQHRSLRLV